MRRLALLAWVIAMICLWETGAHAENTGRAPGLLDRIESFGDRLFSGLLPSKKPEASTSRVPPTAPSATSRRAGSAFDEEEASSLVPRPDPLVSGVTADRGTDPRTLSSVAPAAVSSAMATSVPGDVRASLVHSPGDVPRASASTVTGSRAEHLQEHLSSPAGTARTGRVPLYERVAAYRMSPFGGQAPSSDSKSPENRETSPPLTSGPSPVARTPQSSSPGSASPSALSQLSEGAAARPSTNVAAQGAPRAAEMPGTSGKLAVGMPKDGGAAPGPSPTSQHVTAPVGETDLVRTHSAASSPTSAAGPLGSPASPSSSPVTAQPTLAVSGGTPSAPTPAVPRPAASVSQGHNVKPRDLAPEVPPEVTAQARANRAISPASNTGATQAGKNQPSDSIPIVVSGPVLAVETVGPKSITLGKPGKYELYLKNQGGRAADDVRLSVAIPKWAEVISYEASSGSATAAPEETGTTLMWTLEALAAGKTEKLSLELIPRESQSIELAVEYTFAPPRTETKIEVREPKLRIELDGPQEVLFGRSEVYRVIIANEGSADAEDVKVIFHPLSKSQKNPITQPLGNLTPGQKRTIELELVARETGPMVLKIDTTAAGNIAAHAEQEIAVVKPELQVAVNGPSMQFVGQSDQYVVTVSNPGTAPAENVQISVQYSSAMAPVVRMLEGARIENRKITWTIPSLGPGVTQEFPLPCQFLADGEARLAVETVAEGGLSAEASLTTVVQTVANLVLHVEDPGRPLPVGQEGTYRIIVENKGSKAATEVQVVGFFSEGIEPVRAEGAASKILPGQVIFETIDRIEAGEKIVVTVQAKAEQAGNHIFRAEVRCPSSAIQLALETTTHYFDPSIASRASGTSELR